ncbi:uncharacterized protein LOC135119813 [Zophobas morio]|jgi:hypothetical protein|uniref:uncharacterized protein LOC135119813 n=1 Tax=Zophobas morio TaxID=2755281 RepID=UPI00308371C5
MKLFAYCLTLNASGLRKAFPYRVSELFNLKKFFKSKDVVSATKNSSQNYPAVPTVKPYSYRLFLGGLQGVAFRKRSKLLIFSVWSVFTLLGAVASCAYDDAPERVLSYFRSAETFWTRLFCQNEIDLGYILEAAVRIITFSDDVKEHVVHYPGVIERMLAIIDNESLALEVREKACVCINECSRCDKLTRILGERGVHLRLLEIAFHTDSLLLRQLLSQSLCHFAEIEHLRKDLALNGAITFLEACYSSYSIGRWSHREALMKICYTFSQAHKVDLSSLQSPREKDLVNKYATEMELDLTRPYYDLRKKIRKSGIMLYFHTGGGGLVWGAFEGWALGNSVPHVLKYAVRNAVVSSLLPIYFVGATVYIYSYLRKRCETAVDLFKLNFGTGLCLFPWLYLLPKVERYAPYWIGGHILGFLSFFTFLVLSGSDILTNSYTLKLRDLRMPKSLSLEKG